MRVIVYQDNIYVTGNSLSSSNRPHYNDVFLAKLDIDEFVPRIHSLIPIVPPYEDRVEKNWIPLILDKRICAIYKLYPLVVCEMKKSSKFERLDTVDRVYSQPMSDLLSTLSGSSNLVKVENRSMGNRIMGIFHAKFVEKGN